MKTRWMHALGFAVLCLLAAVPASAGDIGLYGSYWDTDALGETAGAGIRFGFGSGAVRFELRGSYFPDLSEDFDELVEDGDLDVGDFEIKATVPEAGLVINLAPNGAVQPYVGGGVSYYLLDTNLFELDDEVGYYGVAGFTLGGGRGSGAAFFAEAMYRSVEGTVREDDDELDEDVDIDLSGLAVNAGVRFRF